MMSRIDQALRDFLLVSEAGAELYVNEVLDGSGRFQYLDKVASVSALTEPEPVMWLNEENQDEQYRRFLNCCGGS